MSCIQPNLEASARAAGGWGRVVGWCQRNGGEALARIFEIPSFEGGETYSHLLIQLDGDTAQELSAFLGGGDVPEDISVDDRVDLVVTLLHNHLRPSPQHAPLILYAIPVMQTEAWILAGIVDEELEFESIDAKSEFRRRFVRFAEEPKAEVYKLKSEEAAENIERITERAISFRRFRERMH